MIGFSEAVNLEVSTIGLVMGVSAILVITIISMIFINKRHRKKLNMNLLCKECNGSGKINYPSHLLAYSSFKPEFEEFTLECHACK